MPFYLAEGAVVKGDVTLGDDASVWYNATIRGDSNPVVIGERTNIQDNAVIHVERTSAGRHIAQVGTLAVVHGALVGVPLLAWDGVGRPLAREGWQDFAARWLASTATSWQGHSLKVAEA